MEISEPAEAEIDQAHFNLMARRMLTDTGPLVAILNARDSQYAACRQVAAAETGPLITSWPIIAEAMYMLGKYEDGGASGSFWTCWLPVTYWQSTSNQLTSSEFAP